MKGRLRLASQSTSNKRDMGNSVLDLSLKRKNKMPRIKSTGRRLARNKENRKMEKPKCPQCGKRMKNAIDSKTKEISEYLWECNCKGMENFRLSRG